MLAVPLPVVRHPRIECEVVTFQPAQHPDQQVGAFAGLGREQRGEDADADDEQQALHGDSFGQAAGSLR